MENAKQIINELKCLKEDSASFETILSVIPGQVFLKNKDLRFTYVNHTFADALGLNEYDVIGKTISEVFYKSPELAKRYEEADKSLMKDKVQSYETQIRNKDGSFEDVLINKSIIEDKDGNFNGIVGLVNIITKQKDESRALALKTKEYAFVFDNSYEPKFILDVEQKVLDCNQAALEILELKDKKDLIGKTLVDFTPYTQDNGVISMEYIKDYVVPLIEKNDYAKFEFNHLNAKGEKLYLNISINKIKIDNNNTILMAQWKDISSKLDAEKARENEKKVLSLFDSGDTAIFEWNNDENWSVKYASKSTNELFGYKSDEFYEDGFVYSNLICTNDLKNVIDEVTFALENNLKVIKHKPYRIKTKTGEIKWVHDFTNVLYEKGLVVGFLGYLVDITDIIDTKYERDKLKDIISVAFESTKDGVWDLDLENKSIYLSKEWKEMFGYGEDKDLFNLVDLENRLHPEDKDKTIKYIQDHLMHKTQKYESRHRMRCKDGTYKHILDRGKALFRDGKPYKMVGICTDITKQVKEHENLQLLEQAFNSTSDGVIVVDIQNALIVNANERASEMYGCNFGNLNNKNVNILDKSITKQKLKNILNKINKEHFIEFEWKYTKSDDDFIYKVHITKAVFKSNIYLVASLSDISSEKAYELKLKHEKDKALKANRSKSQFLANMSHEIRTPMNAIIGFSDLLVKSDLYPSQKSFATSIESSSKTLLVLINDILDFSKIESGKVELNIVKTEISKYMDDIKNMFELLAKKRGLEFYIKFKNEIPRYLYLDDTKVRQILINLIGNALKFTKEGLVCVELEFKKQNNGFGTLDIDVIDSGIGVKKDSIEKIFKIFEQSDAQSTREYGGTGLGLSISKSLAKMHNGDVVVKSEPSKGSTFSLVLNKIKYDNSDTQNIVVENIDYEFEVANVLVVDDIQTNRILIDAYLDDTPLKIYEACNGAVALDILKSNKIDIVLMDIRMPVMDGYEATKIIKNDETLKNIPVVAVTASVVVNNKENMKKKGFDDFLRKPLTEELLLTCLSSFLPNKNLSKEIQNTIKLDDQKLKKLFGELNNNSYIMDKFSEVKNINNFDAIKDFAKELYEISSSNGCEYICEYSQKLISAVDNFDLDMIESLFNDFELIKHRLDNE